MILKRLPMAVWRGADLETVIRVGIVFLLIWFGGNILGTINNPFIDTVSEQIWGIGLYALAALGYAVLYGIFWLPAVIVEELGGFVEKPYELSPEPHPDEIVESPEYTRAINVKTTTHFDVTECRLELLEAKNIDSGKDILRRREYLAWSDREEPFKGHEPKTIQGEGGFRLCNVAYWRNVNQKAYFTFAHVTSRPIPDGIYLLTIKITGKWREHNFNKKEEFYLKYENNIIQIGNSLNELDNDISEVVVKIEERDKTFQAPADWNQIRRDVNTLFANGQSLFDKGLQSNTTDLKEWWNNVNAWKNETIKYIKSNPNLGLNSLNKFKNKINYDEKEWDSRRDKDHNHHLSSLDCWLKNIQKILDEDIKKIGFVGRSE